MLRREVAGAWRCSMCKDMLKTIEGRCKECYACVRACPVKAIRMAEGKAEVMPDRCVRCGECLAACTQRALAEGDDLEVVRGLLASDRLVVLVLAPEYPASFGTSADELEGALASAGFYSTEDSILGEEIVAAECERLAGKYDDILIRSTCPTVVSFIKKYHPNLAKHLVPVVPPTIAQARLIKEIIGDVAVVYAGPCFAMKGETARDGSIDAALTFKELKEILAWPVGALGDGAAFGAAGDFKAWQKTSRRIEDRPVLKREISLPGGLPRSLLSGKSLVDARVKVTRSLEELNKLAGAITRGEVAPQFIDALACDGCINGPGMDSLLSPFAKKAALKLFSDLLQKDEKAIPFSQIKILLPNVDVVRAHDADGVKVARPTEAEIRRELAKAEMAKEEDELDCGGCGYPTCRDMAIAVYWGLSSWTMCYPYQKKIFARIVRELKDSSATDGLTGLPNHKSLEDRLAAEFHRARRYGSPLSLIMIDLDEFKDVNDTFGHQGGNRFLRSIAKLLRENVRQSDFVARYGGDEFVVILPETEEIEAVTVSEKLRKRAENGAILLGGGVARSTLSLGVSSLLPSMRDPSDLIELADRALYEAKRSGRNRTRLARWS